MLYDTLIAPFVEFEFMRRALVGTLAIALGAGPVGVFLMLRRMSLVGDAMAHAILPGAAIGFLLQGLNLIAMTAGGLIAGFVVAFGAGLVTRFTELKEDASLATFYLVSLALGVMIISLKGTNLDLLHVLFGNVLALDDQALVLIAAITSFTLVVLALIYRPLVLECVDPGLLRSVGNAGAVPPQRRAPSRARGRRRGPWAPRRAARVRAGEGPGRGDGMDPGGSRGKRRRRRDRSRELGGARQRRARLRPDGGRCKTRRRHR